MSGPTPARGHSECFSGGRRGRAAEGGGEVVAKQTLDKKVVRPCHYNGALWSLKTAACLCVLTSGQLQTIVHQQLGRLLSCAESLFTGRMGCKAVQLLPHICSYFYLEKYFSSLLPLSFSLSPPPRIFLGPGKLGVYHYKVCLSRPKVPGSCARGFLSHPPHSPEAVPPPPDKPFCPPFSPAPPHFLPPTSGPLCFVARNNLLLPSCSEVTFCP